MQPGGRPPLNPVPFIAQPGGTAPTARPPLNPVPFIAQPGGNAPTARPPATNLFPPMVPLDPGAVNQGRQPIRPVMLGGTQPVAPYQPIRPVMPGAPQVQPLGMFGAPQVQPLGPVAPYPGATNLPVPNIAPGPQVPGVTRDLKDKMRDLIRRTGKAVNDVTIADIRRLTGFDAAYQNLLRQTATNLRMGTIIPEFENGIFLEVKRELIGTPNPNPAPTQYFPVTFGAPNPTYTINQLDIMIKPLIRAVGKANVTDVTFEDYKNLLRRRLPDPQYDEALRQNVINLGMQANPELFERARFDAVKQQLFEEAGGYNVDAAIRGAIERMVRRGKDLEDVTMEDVDYDILFRQLYGEGQQYKKEFRKRAGFAVFHEYEDNNPKVVNAKRAAFENVHEALLRALPIYTEAQMRERIALRLRDYGGPLDMVYKPRDYNTGPATAAEIAAAVKKGSPQEWINFNKSTTLMGLLMDASTILLIEVMEILGYTHLNDTIDVYYNLLWYLIYGDVRGPNLPTNKAERAFISGLSVEQLLAILGPTYTGPRDKASLMITALCGKTTALPDNANIDRYPEIAIVAPSKVWTLAYDLYDIINAEDQIVSDYPPYKHVALRVPTAIESIILSVNEGNVDRLLQRYGMFVKNYPRGKVNFFVKEISKYEPIFSRPANTPPPPPLTGMTKQQIKDTLAIYTFRELFDAYEVSYHLNSRAEYIARIADKVRGGGAKWSWRHKWCNNDATLNVVEGTVHGRTDKDDKENPTLSYGVVRNYRCYQVYELEGSFREDDADGVFHFRVPDWAPPTPGRPEAIDPTTGLPLVRDFPIPSMRQLKRLLETEVPEGVDKAGIDALKAKIDAGIAAIGNTAGKIRAMRKEYDEMTAEEKYLVELYLGWLFYYGMWMRFWKGPGNPLPLQWKEGGGGADRCETGRRDENINIQHSVKTSLETAIDANPKLRRFIDELPLIDYNFKSGEANMSGEKTLKSITDLIMLGDFCMAHGSDLVSKTSYYLITQVLNHTTTETFNAFLNMILPPLLNIEKQIVDIELPKAKQPRRVEALQARKAELEQPMPVLKPFIITEITGAGHTDPEHGYGLFKRE